GHAAARLPRVNHLSSPSAVANASYTLSRGARMKTLCFTSGSSRSSGMALPLLDIALQPLQTRLPARRHGRQPFAGGGETLRFERIVDVTAQSLARDEARFTE